MRKILVLILVLTSTFAHADDFEGVIKEVEGKTFLTVSKHIESGVGTNKRDSFGKDYQLRIKDGDKATKDIKSSDNASLIMILTDGAKIKISGKLDSENVERFILVTDLNSLQSISSAAETIVPEEKFDPFAIDGVKIYTEHADPNISNKSSN